MNNLELFVDLLLGPSEFQENKKISQYRTIRWGGWLGAGARTCRV